VAKCYTMLDVRLGLVGLTEEQKQIIRTKVFPIFAQAAKRELAKRKAEYAKQTSATTSSQGALLLMEASTELPPK